MDTMAQLRDREHRLREALRLGLCSDADPVRTCLERLAAHERQAALVPALLAFVRDEVLPYLALYGTEAAAELWELGAALVARAEGETL